MHTQMRVINIFTIFFLLFILCGCVEDEIVSPPQVVTDEYEGSHNQIQFAQETKDFIYGDLVFHIKTSDGTIIKREATHNRLSGISRFIMEKGLKEGKYQILSMEYIIKADCPEINGTKRRFGLGCFVQVGKEGIQVDDTYNDKIGLWGKGIKEDPYRICTPDDLDKIRQAILSGHGKYVTSSTCFEQQCDIDMSGYNDICGWEGNWYQIGLSSTYPFTGYYNGKGYKISNLKMLDTNAIGASLFGYVNKALITNVVIENANINGYCGISAIAGMIITSGEANDATCIRGCSVRSSTIKGRSDGIGVGAIAGFSDPNVKLWIDSCDVSRNKSTGAFAVGGILGGAAALSTTQITNTHNRNAEVEAFYNNAGGIVGYADTLFVFSCSNTADIYGSTGKETLRGLPAGSIVNVGTGGIAGGSGTSLFIGNTNNGKIEGSRGVGGIIGSTMVNVNPETYYNDVFVGYCHNTGEIKGNMSIGGLCGEAQLSCYKSYNEGKINATGMYAGGILGNASIASISNVANFAMVSAPMLCGGLAGQIIVGSIALNTNLGNISSTGDYAGGMIGRAGNTLAMNYCANFSTVKGDSYIGGLIGKVGSPREWTGWDTAGLVLASVEAVIGIGSAVFGTLFGLVPGAIKALAKPVQKVAEIVINVVFLSIDSAVYLYDLTTTAIKTSINIFSHFFSHSETELLTASLKGIVINDVNQINMNLENLLGKSLIATIFSNLPSGLKGIETAKEFMKQRAEITAWSEKEANLQIFNNAMNYKIDQRYKAEISTEKVINVVHSVINGVCLVASATGIAASLVGSIVGTPVAGAVIIAGFSIAVTGISFANSVISILDQFEKNAIVITQCISFGTINSPNGNKVGGLVGRLEDGGLIADCLNGTASSNGGAIVGSFGKHVSINRCLNIGASWPVYAPFSSNVNTSYCLNGTTKEIYPVIQHDDGSKTTLVYYKKQSSLSDAKTLSILDFEKLWFIPYSGAGGFPVPYKSEMQEVYQ